MFGERIFQNGSNNYVVDLDSEEAYVLGCAYRNRVNRAVDNGEEAGLIFDHAAELKRRRAALVFHETVAGSWLEEAAKVASDYRQDLLDLARILDASHTGVILPAGALGMVRQYRVADYLSKQLLEEAAVLDLQPENLQPESFQ